MSIEGRLSITLNISADGIVPTITSSRPLHASRIFTNKPAAQILQTLPLLFNICGKAQSVAAVRAIESAMQCAATDRVEQNRQAIVFSENLREHLWRILIDWQGFIGLDLKPETLSKLTISLTNFSKQLDPDSSLTCLAPSADKPTATLRKQWQEVKTLIQTIIFGMPIEAWQQMQSVERLHQWSSTGDAISALCVQWIIDNDWQSLGDSEIEPLPPLDAAALRDKLDSDHADQFIATPTWQGNCFETGPLSRQMNRPLIQQLSKQHGKGILTRMTARLTEIADLINKLDDFIHGNQIIKELHSESGLAIVEAARGRLIHRVIMNGDTVERYRILAPTEWNFHPEGTTASSLASLAVTDNIPDVVTLKRQADMIIHSIDPCVGYDLTTVSVTE